jgi:hypothetical protein
VNPKNFFAELKRRNVHKGAIAYAVVTWPVEVNREFPRFRATGLKGSNLLASDASYGKKQAAGLALRQDATSGHPSGSLPQ